MKIATEGVFDFLVLTPVQMEIRGKFFVVRMDCFLFWAETGDVSERWTKAYLPLFCVKFLLVKKDE